MATKIMRMHAKMRAGFCVSRRAVAHVSPRSPLPQKYKRKPGGSLIRSEEERGEFSSKSSTEMSFNSEEEESTKADSECGNNNRVMVVVDQSLEARRALQWTLSHTVQSQDTVILLHVTKPSSKQGGNTSNGINQRPYELLSSMKNMCQTRRPGVHVEILIREGKEKELVIVQAAKQQKVSLLVLGQRKRSTMWRLHTMWSAGKRVHPNVVNYCIQNADCMTIAVRKKSRKHGGYLITTKCHKNFWLLA
ncbi:hypothetical protein DM860_010017 [Cuscuta australis]|uniref:UspA domain-containing protein n=1 Tax=Cuscuta australis TaxID=267555 RepID=A0A328DBF0_9ASTE|nr:hypothetical protein DM860_010017 [Cuscuta australis]